MKTLLIFLVSIFSFTTGLHAQTLASLESDKKMNKTYKKALACLNKGKVDEGISKLETVTAKYPNFTKASNRLVGLYMDRGEKQKAIELMQKMDQASELPSAKTMMTLSYALEDEGDYPKAIASVARLIDSGVLTEEQKPKVERRHTELVFRNEAYTYPVDYEPIKMDTQINTSLIEYHPALTADGGMMMYVQLGEGKYRNEDLYMAQQIIPDSFSVGQPVEALNTDNDEGAFSLSQDGNTLIFTACNRKNSIGGCDLYISFRKGSAWSPARNLGPEINSRYWDSSPTIAADGRTIYFSSKRPGGLGGSDIWSVALNKNNKWDEVKNLGAPINTPGNDETPYLHPDNTTLYFVSDGHVGMGSYDIYFSKKSNGVWAPPENLGYPINTSGREGGIFVDLAGNRAYYSSQIDFNNKEEDQTSGDIYYFDLPESIKPELVTYVKVIVRSAKTKGLINADAELLSLDTVNTVSNLITSINGKLLCTIRPGEYSLNISKEGFLFHSENIILTEGASLAEPFVYEVFLQPIEPAVELTIEEPTPIVLNNIFFEVGSARLLDRSNGEIIKLKELLTSNSQLMIKIIGHTDNVGSDSANKKLSDNRAKAVYDKLISYGISSSRIAYEGRGESQPVADNDTEAGRQKNRRTEFIILN